LKLVRVLNTRKSVKIDTACITLPKNWTSG